MVRRMKEKVLAEEDGFTLLEIMISIFILSVALITLSGLMTSTIRSTDYGRRATEAANLARETIEGIERTAALNFDSIQDTVPASDPVSGLNPDNVEDYGTISGHPSFRRETYITDGASPVNAKDIAVKVIWDDGIGSGHNIIFRTVIAR
jgi:prepilin-type N-terminal cleavage/methylation domain-containing protein